MVKTVIEASVPHFILLFFLVPFFLGACLGSFLNVCVYRIPLGKSVVEPPSACPACGTPIPAWRNIPVVTWVSQRGRAACCGVKIPVKYLLWEIFTGSAGVGIFWLILWLSKQI